ncbi:YbhB/YbcL family Raf kinase inhibitor-like protein [Paraflavisolibacter sp. H34]|uniref:YbhB/YbcL family Raf kinase inhibitor-like protein n=1 Tax=Huijunlia imazamoxiresistens TaxID=3127457 RepID=UPI00301935A6
MAQHLKDYQPARGVDQLTLKVSSTAFTSIGIIPSKYTCDGANINPPLDIEGIPDDTASLALIVDDPDAPSGTFTHWLLWNIPLIHHLPEDQAPGIQGTNGFRQQGYGGPCPPSGTHHYHFKVYALDAPIDLAPGASREELEQAMAGHIIGYGELLGLYKRQ